MAGKKPIPATVEDYDEEFDDIVPESQQVANTAAKVVTRSDHRFPAEPLIDGASDSGYSSRTAATANSTQSGPSGGKSPPVPHKLHMPKQRADLDRKTSIRRERKDKDRSRPGHEESMRVGAYPGSAQYHSHVPRSPSKSRRRDSSARHYQDAAHYYEGGPVYHHQPSTPIDRHPNMEYPPSLYGRPPMPDMVPSSPHSYAPRHAYAYEEYHRPSSRPSRSHSYRHPGGYHQERPMSMSFHEMSSMGPPGLYHPQVNPYEYGPSAGPPPSNSAYYASSPYGAGSYMGYAGSEYTAPMEYGPERSPSRTREPSRSRRGSVYDRRMIEPEEIFPDLEEFEPMERYSSREPRGRHSSKPSQGRDEDYYRDYSRMPPPPPPMPKARAAPKIIQNKRPDGPRKSQTVQAVPSVPTRRMSRAAADHGADFMDVSDLRNALPDPANRRLSREAGMIPDRTQSMRESMRESRRSNSYHDTGRGARVAVENSRRRRPERSEQYYYDDHDSHGGDLEDQVSNVEEYQNAKAGRSGAAAALPPSTESLITKMANGAGSDNGSRKSGSNSSRESGTGSKAGQDKNISLMMDGIQLGFKEEAVQGKMINIRSDDAGGFHLSLGGSRKPKAYLPSGSSYSDKTNTASRRELVEDVRRTRDDRRLERGSRRSSQSTYGRRF